MKISFFGITAAVAAMALTLQTGKVSADALPSVSELSFQALSRLSGMPSVNPPRTKYLDSQGAPVYRNRLLLERSPYLRQHAHNPIDWRPWGDEALAEANKRGVPIFLSVGYATCHWCHVMEEESFDNVDIARTMNRNFIAVKVDRETLPQIDAQYMIATQLLRGSGGWPNNVFLTPEGAPIVSLGYEPPATFHETLQTISADWTDPDGNRAMRNQALSVAEFVNLIMRQHGEAAEIDEEVYAKGTAELLADFDNAQGGFGRTPKFPNESMVGFLLDRYERDGDTAALDAALVTLRAIAAGGIHDQVGGGFHRYAVDQNWRTPHFEKMLYTQANLTQNMLQAYRLEGDPVLGRAARRALDYVLRDMTAPNGAFYAAQDADSAVSAGGEIEEGAFYTWNFAQLESALGIGAVDGVRGVLGLDQPPTVPTGAVAHFNPQAVPDFVRLEQVLETLRNARNARPAPLTDTKVIAGWNGLMIGALAEGAIVLKEPRYLAAAERAARFIRTSMLSPRGDLARAYANGPLGEGALRDYVWLAQAHIALADATGNRDYLTIAAQLGQEILNRFKEREDAPLRYAQNPGPLGASFDVLEGANPPGNASAIELFSALANRVSDEHQGNLWNREAEALIAAMSSSIVDAPRDNISATAASASHLSGATGSKRFMGQGAATAQLFPEGGTIRLLLEFAPGWHANAEKPLGDNLIPTRFGGPGLGQVRYPSPRSITLGFQDEPLLVLEGSGEITAARIADGAREARLDIQLCNDSYCLPPETHIFRFAPLR